MQLDKSIVDLTFLYKIEFNVIFNQNMINTSLKYNIV